MKPDTALFDVVRNRRYPSLYAVCTRFFLHFVP